jgi:molecular chaperone GrpE
MTDTRDEEAENNPSTNGSGERGAGDGARAAAEALPPATPEERLAALEAERKEQGEGEARVREGVLKDMLEVIDNLERATSAYSDGAKFDGAAVLKGVSLVLRLFQTKLERYGVRPFEAQGQPFDPREHEAISQVVTADFPPGTVANELQKGYRIGDRLLRPASVAVAAAPKGEGQA